MKKFFLALIVLSIAFNAHAQETVIFQSSKSSSSSKSKANKNSNSTNIIKLAPLSFISGFVPVFYERNINDFVSIQAGIGITTKNYILDGLAEAGATGGVGGSSSTNGITDYYKRISWVGGNTNSSYYNENPTYGGDGRKTSLGYIISVEPRIYFASEAPDGSFMGLNLSTRRNNYSSNAVSTTATSLQYTGAKIKEFDNLSTMMVNFGYQTVNDNLSFEYSGGIGLRKIKGEHYIYTNGTSNGKYITGTGFIDRTKVAFDLSFKVGYHF
jgi:hypothetical protein